jgi:hypothetical protein
VSLDAEFAHTVHGNRYNVFVTPYGDCRGLYVYSHTTTGFEVRELKSGTSSLEFAYRIVAKRKDL